MYKRGWKAGFYELDWITKFGVGLPEILDEKADKSVTRKVEGNEKPLEGLAVPKKPDEGPEDNSFEKHLVKLGWMPGVVQNAAGAGNSGKAHLFSPFPDKDEIFIER